MTEPTDHKASTGRVRRRGACKTLGLVAGGALLLAGMGGAGSPAGAQSIEQMDVTTVHCTIEFLGDQMLAYYVCSVPASGRVSVEHLPGSLDADTPVILTATGTKGPNNDTVSTHRRGGDGGKARTVVTAADLGDSLYVYTQPDAPGTNSGRGGSAAVLTRSPIEIGNPDDVLLIAGGGGSQGEFLESIFVWCGGGTGGRGGVADAALPDVDAPGANPANAYGAGTNGQSGTWKPHECQYWTGNRGLGGYMGVGGTQAGDRRSDGIQGFGGPGGGSGWFDQHGNQVVPYYPWGGGGHSTVWASGGGGHGGGAGGERGYGAGGGGSLATAPTASPVNVSLIADELRTDGSDPGITLVYPFSLP